MIRRAIIALAVYFLALWVQSLTGVTGEVAIIRALLVDVAALILLR